MSFCLYLWYNKNFPKNALNNRKMTLKIQAIFSQDLGVNILKVFGQLEQFLETNL